MKTRITPAKIDQRGLHVGPYCGATGQGEYQTTFESAWLVEQKAIEQGVDAWKKLAIFANREGAVLFLQALTLFDEEEKP